MGPGSPSRAARPFLSGHRPQTPFAGHTAQLVLAAIFECDSRSDHQVLDGPGDDELTGPRSCQNTSGDVDSDPPDVVAEHLNLAGVHAGAQLEAELRARSSTNR